MRRERWWFCGEVRFALPGVGRSPGAAGIALIVLLASSSARATDLGDGLVRLRHATIAARADRADDPRATPLAPLEPRHSVETWVVAFDTRRDEAVRDAIGRVEARVVGYAPSAAYIVRGSAASAQALGAAAGVRRIELVRPQWRVSPDLALVTERGAGDPLVFVDLYAGEAAEDVVGQLGAAGIPVLRADRIAERFRLLVRLPRGETDTLAGFSEVEWIEPVPSPTLRNDRVRWVIQSNDALTFATPLHDRGLFGAGEIIGHVDTSPNPSHCFFIDPDGNEIGPAHRKLVTMNEAAAPHEHGSHTAGTACGENLESSVNRGMAPQARLAHTNWSVLHGQQWDGLPSTLYAVLSSAHEAGARIHTNSWGDDRFTSYTDWCVDVDTFSREREDDLILFAISNSATLRSPENAKNSLAVGASFAAGLQDSISNGGSGPTIDGRRKPEVYAPGRGTVSSGTAGCATASFSGTSMASPAVAGGTALVREYYRRGYHPTGRARAPDGRTPTGALLKATVINSTVDMTLEAGYPGPREGWGRILLDDALYFEGDARRLWYRDVRHLDGLATGESRQWSIEVVSADEPLAVTLAFMDEPASQLATVAAVNDLDLDVEGPDGFFHGNWFDTDAGVSLENGTPDPLNNVERVIVAVPTPGTWTVRVRGAFIPVGPQGFAVVANGAFLPRTNSTALAKDRGEDPPLPEAPVLLSPRPTPFRTTTDVPFVLPRPGRAVLRAYDVSGHVVRLLEDRTMEAGEHVATWDGRNDGGNLVAPGIYWIRLSASGVERTVRTVRLR